MNTLPYNVSVSSPCEICLQAEVDHTCDRCGQLVCSDHYDEEIGYCVECVAEVSGGRNEQERDDEDLPDGVDTYRF